MDEKFSYKAKNGDLIPCWNDKRKNEWNNKDINYKTWQFDQKIAKIACAYYQKGVIKDYYDYIDELYTEDGGTFRMNLYPISFPDTDDQHWRKNHFEQTGFPNKIMYKAWCMEHRFPILRKYVTENKPKAIICTGDKCAYDFLLAFAPKSLFDNSEPGKEESEIYTNGKKKINIKWIKINGGSTFLVITPFLGQGGLMADRALINLGEKMNKLIYKL